MQPADTYNSPCHPEARLSTNIVLWLMLIAAADVQLHYLSFFSAQPDEWQ
jgi:hypothetical protein